MSFAKITSAFTRGLSTDDEERKVARVNVGLGDGILVGGDVEGLRDGSGVGAFVPKTSVLTSSAVRDVLEK